VAITILLCVNPCGYTGFHLTIRFKMIVRWAIRYLVVVGCARLVVGVWDVRDAETGIVKELGGRLSEGGEYCLEGKGKV
jgi:hypothetical protein